MQNYYGYNSTVNLLITFQVSTVSARVLMFHIKILCDNIFMLIRIKTFDLNILPFSLIISFKMPFKILEFSYKHYLRQKINLWKWLLPEE